MEPCSSWCCGAASPEWARTPKEPQERGEAAPKQQRMQMTGDTHCARAAGARPQDGESWRVVDGVPSVASPKKHVFF